ncbi:nuclease-related domain-containing protein [Pseudalkalibacillus sp. Hm43]
MESWWDSSKSGEWGERSLDYYLSFLNESSYLIFDGTRLSGGRYYFQMDTLLVHPSFIIIFEVKNLAGTLIFDTDHNQLIQQIEDKEVIYKDPIQQVEHQHFQLTQWLLKYNFPDQIPIQSYVVIANERAKIVSRNNETLLAKKVIRNTKILNTINDLHHIHKKQVLRKKDLQKLKDLIIRLHTPHNPDLMTKLNIRKEELLTGVQCPQCLEIPMNRARNKWICPQCNTTSTNAHINALRDYFILFEEEISNKQMRDYLHIQSKTTCQRFISSLKLNPQGTYRNRTYQLHSLWPNKY